MCFRIFGQIMLKSEWRWDYRMRRKTQLHIVVVTQWLWDWWFWNDLPDDGPNDHVQSGGIPHHQPPSAAWSRPHVRPLSASPAAICPIGRDLRHRPRFAQWAAIRAMSWHSPHRPRPARGLSRKRNKVDHCDHCKFRREPTQIERMNSINPWKLNPSGKILQKSNSVLPIGVTVTVDHSKSISI
jgi:hypothetical protein